jgi:hypothetical protein
MHERKKRESKWKRSYMFRKELDRMDQEKEEAARMFR